jgi:nicotinate dehydrogenase subunit A
MTKRVTLKVNGATRSITVDPETPLLYVLRNDFKLDGPKFGCGLSQCGACAVLSDGREIRSCVTPVAAASGHAIVTNEGLGTAHDPSPVQAAFIAEQAAQCGYCASGMIVAATSLLNQNPRPSHDEIVAGMDGHLCRCATYVRIVAAVERASKHEVKA